MLARPRQWIPTLWRTQKRRFFHYEWSVWFILLSTRLGWQSVSPVLGTSGLNMPCLLSQVWQWLMGWRRSGSMQYCNGCDHIHMLPCRTCERIGNPGNYFLYQSTCFLVVFQSGIQSKFVKRTSVGSCLGRDDSTTLLMFCITARDDPLHSRCWFLWSGDEWCIWAKHNGLLVNVLVAVCQVLKQTGLLALLNESEFDATLAYGAYERPTKSIRVHRTQLAGWSTSGALQ